MIPKDRRARGFTLIEMMVVVAIIVILSALAYTGLSHYRPRASLASASAELQSLIHYARQSALASGQDVAVMIFPDYANNSANGTGRVVVYRDGTFDLFVGATGGLTFAGYDAAATPINASSEVLGTLDLPRGVIFGPVTGMGAGATLVAPLNHVTVNLFCSFCSTTGDRRGAIKFDSKGSPTFYGSNGLGNPTNSVQVNGGASLSLQSSDLSTPQHTVVVTTPTGAVLVLKKG